MPHRERPEKFVLYDSTHVVFSGWISPEGDCYPCDYANHIFLAGNIVYHLFGEDMLNSWDASRYLEEQGWLHLAASGVIRYLVKDIRITEAQLSVLWDLATTGTSSFSEKLKTNIELALQNENTMGNDLTEHYSKEYYYSE